MDEEMPRTNVKRATIGPWLAVAILALGLALPMAAEAQVVVVANGSPITELDIQQRTKLLASSTHKNPTRQEVINELIDDRIKITKAKMYGLEVTDADVDSAYQGMATRQHITPEQFAQFLERAGVSPAALKARIRAELTWSQLVRGKFGPSLQVGEADIANALKARNEANTTAVGYNYTLYPITIVVPRGAGDGVVSAKRQEAENLRGRFTSCTQGLALARGLRDVAVREPVTRNSSDLPQQLRDTLNAVEVGRLTSPEVTAQGVQMFAVCGKKESTTESPAQREAREQIFNKRYEAESKKYLDEIRKQAMIEYK
jgi:peptidyl-prolyl cis-trans isomerase SurA